MPTCAKLSYYALIVTVMAMQWFTTNPFNSVVFKCQLKQTTNSAELLLKLKHKNGTVLIHLRINSIVNKSYKVSGHKA